MKTIDYLIKQLIDLITPVSSSNITINALFSLTLHSFAAYAPSIFCTYQAEKTLSSLLSQTFPLHFHSDLSADEALAIADILYLRQQYGLNVPVPSKTLLINYLDNLLEENNLMYCWLIGELFNLLNIDVRLPEIKQKPRPYKNKNKVYDLYWLTHLIFLETRYLHQPLLNTFTSEIIDLVGASNWIIATKHLDLAAEVAICLDIAGKSHSKEYKHLIELLLANILTLTPISNAEMDFDKMHTISVTLVALVGFSEKCYSLK